MAGAFLTLSDRVADRSLVLHQRVIIVVADYSRERATEATRPFNIAKSLLGVGGERRGRRGRDCSTFPLGQTNINFLRDAGKPAQRAARGAAWRGVAGRGWAWLGVAGGGGGAVICREHTATRQWVWR